MLKDKFNALIADAMKRKENYKTKVLRLIKSEYQKFLTSGSNKELTDAEEIKILKKLQKQWKEELESLIENNRETFDLTLEIKYLESFIPQELSEKEQRDIISKVIEKYLKDIPVKNRKTMQHLGGIMKIINSNYPTISGRFVAEVYKRSIGM
jgi:uncharacterized protein YqeY